MDNINTTSNSSFSSKNSKPNPVLIIVAIVVVGLIVWWVSRAPESEKAVAPTATPSATLVQDELQQEADQLDAGNLDSEFKEIDQDLNSL